jgi:ABC-type nitrate/sulfonate/bicarbonate transport system permease component
MSDSAVKRHFYSAERLVADAVIILVICLWWLTSRSMSPGVLPGLGQIGGAFLELATSVVFWSNAAATGTRVLLAVTIATIVGSLIGIMPRYIPWTRSIVDDILVPFFTSFPGIAWAILGTIWFGVTSTAVLIVQILIVLPFALVNVTEGSKAIGNDEVEMGRSFTRRGLSVFWRIELPLLTPFILSSVRIAYGVCWKVSLIAELFGAHTGIGYMMQLAQDLGDIDRIIALCLWIVMFVIIGERLLLNPLEKLLSSKSNF